MIAAASASRRAAVSALLSSRPAGNARRVKHHRRGDHRPGQRAAPDLVDAGDRTEAAGDRGGLTGEIGDDGHGRRLG